MKPLPSGRWPTSIRNARSRRRGSSGCMGRSARRRTRRTAFRPCTSLWPAVPGSCAGAAPGHLDPGYEVFRRAQGDAIEELIDFGDEEAILHVVPPRSELLQVAVQDQVREIGGRDPEPGGGVGSAEGCLEGVPEHLDLVPVHHARNALPPDVRLERVREPGEVRGCLVRATDLGRHLGHREALLTRRGVTGDVAAVQAELGADLHHDVLQSEGQMLLEDEAEVRPTEELPDAEGAVRRLARDAVEELAHLRGASRDHVPSLALDVGLGVALIADQRHLDPEATDREAAHHLGRLHDLVDRPRVEEVVRGRRYHAHATEHVGLKGRGRPVEPRGGLREAPVQVRHVQRGTFPPHGRAVGGHVGEVDAVDGARAHEGQVEPRPVVGVLGEAGRAEPAGGERPVVTPDGLAA